MFTVVAAPNAFKGSLSAADVCRCIARGAKAVSSSIRVVAAPMADGGDGTADVLHALLGGTWRTVDVLGPLGEKRKAQYLWVRSQKLAVVELARASGLVLVPAARRNPLNTSTYGTGQLMADAIRRGARRVVLAVGGSATTDGGAGALQALGARFYDAEGEVITSPITGGMLSSIKELELFPALMLVDGCKLEIACDVTNPMLGPLGAARVFGPQKGASAADVRKLETGLSHFVRLTCDRLGLEWRKAAAVPGAGAAGGIAGGLSLSVGARIVPGARLMSDLTGLSEKLKRSDLVITGEGTLDAQTLMGKAPAEVIRLAREARVPAVALAGRLDASPAALRKAGLAGAFSIVSGPMEDKEAMRRAADLVTAAAANIIGVAFAGAQRVA